MEKRNKTTHAYLIIAHNQPRLLQLLIELIDDKRNDIFILLDGKCRDERLCQMKARWSRVVYTPRVDVWWGESSQIEAEMILFETAYNCGPYAYYHLLSGQDLPLKSQDEIHRFFDSHQGKQFMMIGENTEIIGKRLRRHFFHNYKHGGVYTLKQNVVRFIQRMLLSIQKHFLPVPTIDWLPELRMGWNWVSITHDAVAYLVERHPQITLSFEHTFCCDEVFLQSVLWNSPLRDTIVNDSLRLIDWERGKPYTFTYADLSQLQRTDKLFARKFSETDEQLLSCFEQREFFS